MKKSFLILLSLALSFLSIGQFGGFGGVQNTQSNNQQKSLGAEDLTKWSVSIEPKAFSIGDEVAIKVEVTINGDWYIYGSDFDINCGPTLTTIDFKGSTGFDLIGTLESPNGTVTDEIFGCEYKYFKKHATFYQKVKVTADNISIKAYREYQICTTKDGSCIPGQADFENYSTETTKKEVKTRPDPRPGVLVDNPKVEKTNPIKDPSTTVIDKPTTEKDTTKTEINSIDSSSNEIIQNSTQHKTPPTNLKSKGGFDDIEIIHFSDQTKVVTESIADYAWFMLVAFLSGLAALITPCVFPMIPMTVTFFTKGSQNKKGISQALIYGISIIAIYVLFGTILALFNGPGFANWLSTNWVPNVLFFGVFIFFAFSFLGMYEITLPSGLINKVDSQADKGGLIGVFFMAFTLVLVSFSCTGPIVGSILVEAAGGAVIKPILGMLAFSAAFAIPFTLFAIFPSWLNNLPQSGGWLNSVKVVLGLLELAFAFKFLSVADQAYHWEILSREVYLVIWIGVFSVLALYLLGVIRFPHDSKNAKLNFLKVSLAGLTIAFVVYLGSGLFGAPLKALSGLLPPVTHEKIEQSATLSAESTLCETPLYSDQLHFPHGLEGYFDLRQAIKCAKEQKKPLFLDFTGHGCVNCRKMEEYVWSDPEVLKRLKENFIMVELYVDDKIIQIPEEQQYTNQDGRLVKTLGSLNFDFELTKFNQQAQPYYIILEFDEALSNDQKSVLRELHEPVAYLNDIPKYIEFLDKSVEEFKK